MSNSFKLNEKTLQFIHKDTGLDVKTMQSMSCSEIDRHIEEKNGKKLKISEADNRLLSRGSVYVYLKRFIGLNKINKKISRI